MGEWRRDGSSGWVSSSHPSPAPHRAADCGDRWPGPLCLPNLGFPVPLGWGQQGLKLSPLLLARNFCLPALGLPQLWCCCSVGRAAISPRRDKHSVGSRSRAPHVSPSARGGWDTARRGTRCCEGQRISLPVSPCDKEGTLNPVWWQRRNSPSSYEWCFSI